MSRVKIKFPEQNSALYSTIIAVRIGDINYGGHMGNDAVLSLIHESRMQMLHTWGYTELEVAGTGLIMADVMIAYKGEAFYGDKLDITIYATELTEKSFDLLYDIKNGEKDIAHGKTGMLCFDYKARKIAVMPDVLKNRLTQMDF
jgi:acyl-CoA thioester hydrolase